MYSRYAGTNKEDPWQKKNYMKICSKYNKGHRMEDRTREIESVYK